MSTQDAASADFGGTRPPCWPVTPVAGIRPQDLSLPPSARCWKPDGSRAHRVFGRHRMAVPLDGALFNKTQIIDSFSSDMEMQTWKTAARHSSSSGLERGIISDFAKKARSLLIKEGSFMAARALDFLVCGAINEPHLPADGSIPNQFLCVRCDQEVLTTRKHELWDCCGNTLINHTHMKESEYLTSLAQELGDTDQVLFARGLLPRDWLPASELAECNEVKMWESVDFSACATNHVSFASDGSGRSRKTPQTLRQVAFGVPLLTCTLATTHPSLCSKLATWEVRYPASRRFHEPNSGEPSKFSAKSTRSRISKSRLM